MTRHARPRALIVYGGMELHQPRQGATRVADLLASSGMDVTVTGDLNALVADDLGELALVVR